MSEVEPEITNTIEADEPVNYHQLKKKHQRQNQ